MREANQPAANALYRWCDSVLVLAAFYAIGVRYPLPLTSGAIWSFHELGGSSMLVPDHSHLPVPGWISWTALAIATVSIAVAVNAVWRRRGWWSGDAFLLWNLAGHAALMSLTWLVYGRYALVLVPYGIALLLAARPRIHAPVAVATLTVLGVVTGSRFGIT